MNVTGTHGLCESFNKTYKTDMSHASNLKPVGAVSDSRHSTYITVVKYIMTLLIITIHI